MTKQAPSPDTSTSKNVSFQELGRDCYAVRLKGPVGETASLTANIGVVVGRKQILVIDAGPVPAAATAVSESLSNKFGKPVRYVALTHFHARHGLGASGFEGADVVVSDLTRRMLADHGSDNRQLAARRDRSTFAKGTARLVEPNISCASSLSLNLGDKEVRLMHLGRGHTLGDTVVWVEDARVMFTGGLVATSNAPYCADGHLADWPRVLTRIAAFRPNAIMPSSGESAIGTSSVTRAVEQTRTYLETLKDTGFQAVEEGANLREVLSAVDQSMTSRLKSLNAYDERISVNVARAYDEAKGVDMPIIWTTEREASLMSVLGDVAQSSAEKAVDADPAEAAPADSASHVEESPPKQDKTAETSQTDAKPACEDDQLEETIAEDEKA
ncbi:MBL fold metallo-hydrolase [Roseibium sp. CAU 1637]|uniref:MBL fold metallo-hydrolase n=1 Tax=Roseibium limicola TaxID=2816037 RepID=A0A939EQI3_9HYPH|nr:MBL fold metallo-hydrolase [Roseibium limicola]MBO0346111.1 MBL fold metallo-hydrolase [Roseibium limicola]